MYAFSFLQSTRAANGVNKQIQSSLALGRIQNQAEVSPGLPKALWCALVPSVLLQCSCHMHLLLLENKQALRYPRAFVPAVPMALGNFLCPDALHSWFPSHHPCLNSTTTSLERHTWQLYIQQVPFELFCIIIISSMSLAIIWNVFIYCMPFPTQLEV